jgi:hypothetical protein
MDKRIPVTYPSSEKLLINSTQVRDYLKEILHREIMRLRSDAMFVKKSQLQGTPLSGNDPGSSLEQATV